MTLEQQIKVDFVNKVSDALVESRRTTIEKLEYKICRYQPTLAGEYLIITYKGGAKAACCCTGNSVTAVLTEIANYVNSGSPAGKPDGYHAYHAYFMLEKNFPELAQISSPVEISAAE